MITFLIPFPVPDLNPFQYQQPILSIQDHSPDPFIVYCYTKGISFPVQWILVHYVPYNSW